MDTWNISALYEVETQCIKRRSFLLVRSISMLNFDKGIYVLNGQ